MNRAAVFALLFALASGCLGASSPEPDGAVEPEPCPVDTRYLTPAGWSKEGPQAARFEWPINLVMTASVGPVDRELRIPLLEPVEGSYGAVEASVFVASSKGASAPFSSDAVTMRIDGLAVLGFPLELEPGESYWSGAYGWFRGTGYAIPDEIVMDSEYVTDNVSSDLAVVSDPAAPWHDRTMTTFISFYYCDDPEHFPDHPGVEAEAGRGPSGVASGFPAP